MNTSNFGIDKSFEYFYAMKHDVLRRATFETLDKYVLFVISFNYLMYDKKNQESLFSKVIRLNKEILRNDDYLRTNENLSDFSKKRLCYVLAKMKISIERSVSLNDDVPDNIYMVLIKELSQYEIKESPRTKVLDLLLWNFDEGKQNV